MRIAVGLGVALLVVGAFGFGIFTGRRGAGTPPPATSTATTGPEERPGEDAGSGSQAPASDDGTPSSLPGTVPSTVGTSPPTTGPATTTTLPPVLLPTVWAVASNTLPVTAGDGGNLPSGAMNAVDGLPDTAWRVAGNGVGERISIRLGAPTGIVRVGVLTGDHRDGGGGRPVRDVRWIFDDGTEVTQRLASGDEFEFVEAPGVVTSMVTLEIASTGDSEEPGYTAISEIKLYGPDGSQLDPEPETYRHVFPLDPPDVGGYSPGGHGYPATDIFAPVGTPFVAVTSGSVDVVSTSDVWDPGVNDGANRGGLYVGILGDDGIRYYGSHLSAIADGITPGVRVTPGQLLGYVGRSGNARDTTPHLHFGMSAPTYPDDWQTRRGRIDPIPFLDAWRGGDEAATPTLDDTG